VFVVVAVICVLTQGMSPALALSILNPKLVFSEGEASAGVQAGVLVTRGDGRLLSPYDLKRLQVGGRSFRGAAGWAKGCKDLMMQSVLQADSKACGAATLANRTLGWCSQLCCCCRLLLLCVDAYCSHTP
jgi:hypothetical protein